MSGYGGSSNLAAKVSKIYAGVEQNLPDGYTAVEYIESSGTQYIDTGFMANQDTRLVMDFEYTSGDVVFGAYNSGGAAGFALQNVNGTWYQYYGSSAGYTTETCTAGGRYVADLNKNVAYINGVTARTATANTFQGIYPIILCGLHNVANIANLCVMKVYSCQIYDDGAMVRDYVPCIDPNGAVGLFDMVSRVFYGNAGSGVFTAGASIEWVAKSVARKVSKAYVGDENNVARLIYSAETPLVVNYTGTYTDEIVAMSDGTYRLLTLTGSGTLTFNQQVECDIWMCGGGGSGGASTFTSSVGTGSGGGGGGYCQTLFDKTVTKINVSIGAGGAGVAKTSTSGNATTISGDIAATANGGSAPSITGTTVALMALGGNGGSGGGTGNASNSTSVPVGKGQGSTTRPFEDIAQLPLCAGGGGSLGVAELTPGGSGGSDGSDGELAVRNQTNGAGGYYGGGAGASAAKKEGNPATAFGGGGGGKSMYASTADYAPGSGYQGCVMIRIPA